MFHRKTFPLRSNASGEHYVSKKQNMTFPPFSEALYFYIGCLFIAVSFVEIFSVVAFYSTLFSSFTGNQTFVKKRTESKKHKTAVIYHFVVGIFFIVLEFIVT